MTPDTSSEAIERLAANLEAAGMHYGLPIERDCADAAATLRALAQERDAAIDAADYATHAERAAYAARDD